MAAVPALVLAGSTRNARDFYAQLIAGSQSKAAGFLAERERWLRSVQVEGREELLFEFEMLLRGVERYFNLHNLPIDAGLPVVTRDFHDELTDVRDAIDSAIRIARALLDHDSDQKMQFRKYVETQLADDRARRMLLEDELDQDSPQESLFVLRQGFEALRTIIDHLVKQEVCSYSLFSDIGTLLLRDVVTNQYFRPFRPLEFRIEYDRIKSVPILDALYGLEGEDRKLFAVSFLALFRILHYLSYVGADTEEPPERRCRVILALVRSEAVSLVGFLTTEVATRASVKRHRGAALKLARASTKACAAVSARLAEDLDEEGSALLHAAVELTDLFRKQIGQHAALLDKSITGEDLFHQLISRVQMGERLRTDLWALAKLSRDAEGRLRVPESEEASAPESEAATAALAALRRFVDYFHEVGYQLLRYGDFEAFDRYMAVVTEVDRAPLGPVARTRLADDCRMLAEVSQTTFAQVSRRSDLTAKAFDEVAATALVDRFRAG
jgi:hypothetical protein